MSKQRPISLYVNHTKEILLNLRTAEEDAHALTVINELTVTRVRKLNNLGIKL